MPVLSRLIARSLGTAIVALPALAHAQVGHLPTKSPYEDYSIFQTLSIMAGNLGVGQDPAGVAPKSGLLAALRYDVRIGGPAALYVRYGFAPSERNQLDASKPRITRVVATPSVTTHMIDGGFNIDLTGRKTYRHLLPSLYFGAGLVSDFAKRDSGQYQFGTNFSFTYGGALRYVTRRGPQLRLDLARTTWQYQYPDNYFVKASDTTSVLTSTRQRSAWRRNLGATVGITVPIFR